MGCIWRVSDEGYERPLITARRVMGQKMRNSTIEIRNNSDKKVASELGINKWKKLSKRNLPKNSARLIDHAAATKAPSRRLSPPRHIISCGGGPAKERRPARENSRSRRLSEFGVYKPPSGAIWKSPFLDEPLRGASIFWVAEAVVAAVRPRNGGLQT